MSLCARKVLTVEPGYRITSQATHTVTGNKNRALLLGRSLAGTLALDGELKVNAGKDQSLHLLNYIDIINLIANFFLMLMLEKYFHVSGLMWNRIQDIFNFWKLSNCLPMGKFHMSLGIFYFLYSFFSDALPVFLKYFLTPGQGAAGYSLGFSTSENG